MSDKESHEFQILKLRPWAITQALACLLQPSRPLMVAESRGTGNGQGVQRLQGGDEGLQHRGGISNEVTLTPN